MNSPMHLPRRPRVLLVKIRMLGDIVINTACYKVLKDAFPGCRLDILVDGPLASVIEGHPYADEILARPIHRWKEIVRFHRDLCRRNYDLVINMHGGPRSHLLSFMARSPLRAVAKNRRGVLPYNVFLDNELPTDRIIGAVDFQLALLRPLVGQIPVNSAPNLYIRPTAKQNISVLLSGVGVMSGMSYAVIYPGVRNCYRQWPTQRFAR